MSTWCTHESRGIPVINAKFNPRSKPAHTFYIIFSPISANLHWPSIWPTRGKIFYVGSRYKKPRRNPVISLISEKHKHILGYTLSLSLLTICRSVCIYIEIQKCMYKFLLRRPLIRLVQLGNVVYRRRRSVFRWLTMYEYVWEYVARTMSLVLQKSISRLAPTDSETAVNTVKRGGAFFPIPVIRYWSGWGVNLDSIYYCYYSFDYLWIWLNFFS